MLNLTDEKILQLDEKFAKQGIPFHARPVHAAKEILGRNFSMSSKNNILFEQIRNLYERLIPEVKYTWPGMGTGLVASIDQVKKVTIAVIFGSPQMTIYEGLGFSSHEEWQKWCRNDEKIIKQSAFSFADMYDLVYGINKNLDYSSTLWGLASDQLRIVAESLSQSSLVSSSILQPICLTAELAIKGTLIYLGITENDLKNPKLFGHNLIKLSQKMVQEKNHRDDQLLLKMVKKFPDYVNYRYNPTQLTRLEIISLALSAQFIAASSIRRISNSDIANQIEQSDIGDRHKYFA